MKQVSFFKEKVEESKYTGLIEAPVYTPTGRKPHLFELYDKSKYNRLIKSINDSSIEDDEKEFLRICATRHIVFNYELIAEHYSHSEEKLQELFEDSGLVIVDFKDAIANGFVKLCEDVRIQYQQECVFDEE
jgi:hypothetical protein